MKKILIATLVFGFLAFAGYAMAAGRPLQKKGQALAKKGADLFATKGCTACHTIGKGKLVGPDLKGVTKTMTTKWLKSWLKDTNQMLKTDKHAQQMEKEYGLPMPQQALTEEEINALIDYFKANDEVKK